MTDKFLFDSIKEEFGRELRQDKALPFVVDNLNPKLQLRDYQKQAFNRFYAYYENDDAEAYIKPANNIHLAYYMATGSGKTIIMAGLILYLYEKGYRNFLFFVNRSQIVEKTKDNFINQYSSKYLFNDKIIINNKQVNIKVVDNFCYANNNDINICFTTIQGEPKGEYLQEHEKWKEDFLLAIKDKFKSNYIEHNNQNYKIFGLQFYNKQQENDFKTSLYVELAINIG